MDNDGALLEVLRNTYKGLRFRWKYRGLIILPAEQGNAAAADAIRAGQPFLFGGRNSRSAFVTEGVGIPIPVIYSKGRNDLYIHVLLTHPEADVRGRGGTLFQIDGNFHRQCVFDSHCKGI